MFGLGDLLARELRIPVTVKTLVEDDGGRKFVVFDNDWVLRLIPSDGEGGVWGELPQEGDVLVLAVQAHIYRPVSAKDEQ